MAALRFGPFVFLALLAVGTVAAQTPSRVRGTITAASAGGDVISVDNKVQVRLGEKTQIVFAQPIALADIKPGDFLGVTSIKAADGGLTAYEVRRFPQALNPGHRPLDGRDDQTMTNATVGAVVQSASGRELVLIYDGGAQRVAVPESASRKPRPARARCAGEPDDGCHRSRDPHPGQPAEIGKKLFSIFAVSTRRGEKHENSSSTHSEHRLDGRSPGRLGAEQPAWRQPLRI
jgi:hypothetical protein